MSIEATKLKYENALLATSGVVGVGYTNDKIMVYVENEYVIPRIPQTLDGVPVQVVVTGSIRTL